MAKGGWGNVLRSVHTLLDQGIVGGLTDRELLERYASGGGEPAESAFAALVERHGAMVYRVCRSVLRDEHAAQDAFQATFLILARKARSLWVRDSLGPWLHGVAYRTSSCSRSAAARRRGHEQKAAEAIRPEIRDPEPDDWVTVLHEELYRLPERFRDAIVLCYLEGLTHEQAADRLHCPVGTVRSRLSTGRARLRSRLERRGFASLDGVMDATAREGRPVPAALVEMTVRIGLNFAAGVTKRGMATATVVDLVEKGMRIMWISRLTVASLVLIAMGGGTIGALALAQRGPGAQEPDATARPVPGATDAPDAVPRPARSANEQARRTILEARIETARAILRDEEQMFQQGEKDFGDVATWSRRLMEDRLRLARTPAERQAAIREHRNRMLILEQRLDRLAKSGMVKSSTSVMAKYYRLEADQLLVEEGVDLSKETPAPEPKAGPAAPPSPPVPPRL